MRPEEWIIWGYRILLGREPESGDVVQRHLTADFTPDTFRARLMESAEFKVFSGLTQAAMPPDEAELRRLQASFAVPASAPVDGFFIDFLGVKTRCSYLPASYAQFSGAVEQANGLGAVPLHEPAEMAALLRSAAQGTGRFTIMELGAGWGPWLAAGSAAARQRGRVARLIGVEGDQAHFEYLRTHLRDNGIDEHDGHRLLQAVVGPADGKARFPVLPEPSADWGAQAQFAGEASASKAAEYVDVPCVSIATVIEPLDRVDHMHCDIQGAEADALEASAASLEAKVVRLVVGTHGRSIEERLLRLFSGLGWTLEFEKACTFQPGSAGATLANDGVQVWLNPRRS